MDMSDRIKELRTSHKLTQDQFGELCGASKSAVSQWESGATLPSFTNIITMQAKLGFSIDWLVSGDGQGPGENQEARRLVELYAALDKRGRAAVFRVAEAESEYTVKPEGLQRKSG